jgi:hypothetical protein
MPIPIKYPLLNGKRYSFTSIEFLFGTIPLIGIKALNYESSLEPGKVRGTNANKIGRTEGEADHTADAEIYLLEWNVFLAAVGPTGLLAGGFGAVSFPIVVNYAEDVSQPVVTDIIEGCRITKVGISNQSGADPATVKLTLDPMDIKWGGLFSIAGGFGV